MNSVLIWDVPTRAFHWLLAAGFAAAASIALLGSEQGIFFPYHAIIGLTLALLVVMRIIWGFVGTRYARFRSFNLAPSLLLEYLTGHFTGKSRRHLGHTPPSSHATMAFLMLILGLAITGFMLGRGDQRVKELHELLAYATMGLAAVHVLGVAIHSAVHKENLIASMVNGRKMGAASDTIPSGHGVIALIALMISVLWALGLINNLEPAAQRTTIPLTGVAIQIGESEHQRLERPPGTPRAHAQEND